MASIEVEGAKQFRRDLKQIPGSSPKVMTKVHRKIATHVQMKARANAATASGPFADRYRKVKNKINRSANMRGAAVGVPRDRAGTTFHQATFWGTKKRTGWYAQRKYENSTGQQHPEWVGSTWRAGVRGEGPYVINYTVAEEVDEVVELYGDAMDELFADAFPD